MDNHSHAILAMLNAQQLVVLQNKQVVAIPRFGGTRTNPLGCCPHPHSPHQTGEIKEQLGHAQLLHMADEARGPHNCAGPANCHVPGCLGWAVHQFGHTQSLHPIAMGVLAEGAPSIQT
jgi:hypothetical protein